MVRNGWLGLPFFGFTPRDETVACVLSGGGSRGSFQLGALAWLYRNDPKFEPTMFVGTSAGAILAAALAQGVGADQQQEFNDVLTSIWFDMRTSDDMFTPRPWLVLAQTEFPGWRDIVDPPPPAESVITPIKSLTSKFSFLRRNDADAPASPDAPAAIAPPHVPDSEPVLDPLKLALTPDEEIRAEWSLTDIAGLIGHIGRLPQIGTDLATIRLGMEQTRSMYRPGPMLAKLLEDEVFSGDRVRESGNLLRVAMVALESGELRYMREDGRIVDRDDNPLDDETHHLATGILASCSIPAVFRPVEIGQETFVDGGTRENLPAEFAIGHLRAERTYVVSSQSMGVSQRPSMSTLR